MLIREERKRHSRIALFVVLVAAILGNLVGIFLGAILPEGSFQDLVSKSLSFGLDPPLRLDLWVVSFSIGFTLKLNSLSFLFMFLALIFYKKA
jgi:ABC-type dipeptide/oligopeptide/nickel transport system permease subunit